MDLRASIRGLPCELIDLIVTEAVRSTAWLTRVRPRHGRMHILYDIHDAACVPDELGEELLALGRIAAACGVSVIHEVAIPLGDAAALGAASTLPSATHSTVLFFYHTA